MRTAFLGLSHLGLVSSAAWSSFGQPTVAIDPDAARVADVRAGRLPVHEPGLIELLRRCDPWLEHSDDLARLAGCDLVVVAQDVPTDATNVSHDDLITALVERALPHLESGTTIAVMSQVAPGYTRRLGASIRRRRPELAFELVTWVETLVFGAAVERALHPERFIVGLSDPARPLPTALAVGVARFGCPILPMGYESAELAKTAINLFLIGSVTYANTMADLCEAVGADWGEVVPALRLDRRIGPAAYLRPGLGIAGGNLERDLVTLLGVGRRHGVDVGYLESLGRHSVERFSWVRGVLETHLPRGADVPVLALWGLAYKGNTRSTKNSPALRLIAEMAGRASVRAWDPEVTEAGPAVDIAADKYAAVNGADCLLLMADWPEFAQPDAAELRRRMRRPLVVDCCGILARRELPGLTCITMGRQPPLTPATNAHDG